MFFELEKDRKYHDVLYVNNDKHNPFFTVKCPVHDGHQRANRDINTQLCVDIKKQKIGDFVSTVFSDWLITDRVAEILQTHCLTGYRLQPVNVCNNKMDLNLWELIITGSAGKAHPNAGISIRNYCEYCGATSYTPIKKGVGIIINEADWDGSDFFTITEYRKFVLVTEKVKKVIEENNVKGVLFASLSEIGWEE